MSTGGPESLGLSSKHLLFLTVAWVLATPPNQEIKPMVSQLPIVSLASTNGINHVLWVETEKTARPCPWPHSPGKQMDLNLRAALGGTSQDSSLSPLPPLHLPTPSPGDLSQGVGL